MSDYTNDYINETEIRHALSVMKAPGELFEVRIIRQNRRQPLVGYFDDVSVMIDQLKRQDLRDSNVYVVMNDIKPECSGRSARDHFLQSAATSDGDIVKRSWILVDLDPVRPSETSSTDEQVAKAKVKANAVYKFLDDQGFCKPVSGFSGNGCHLLYRVNLKNDDIRKKTVESFLKTLSVLFSDEEVKVDTSTFNAARVCKLYGTLAQKGSDTEAQPHRMSHLVSVPSVIQETKAAVIEKVIEILPSEPDRPQRYNGYNGAEFDLSAWLSKYGIMYREVADTEGTKYILEHCPFNESHTGKDAVIYRRRNGAIGFHCFHDSCADKRWQDVRLLYEPDAYQQRYDDLNRQMYTQFNRDRGNLVKMDARKNLPGVSADVPVFESAKYILSKPTPEETFIKTGTHDIDRKLRGLKKGYVTLMSGLRGSGKSTFLSQIILKAVDSGNRVAVFSGELTDKNFMRWMYQQAAGKNHVEASQYEGFYTVPRKHIDRIADWLEAKFWLYNNDYGNRFDVVAAQFEKAITEKQLDLLVLDNLMALDIKGLSQDKYEAQTAFVLDLERMAKKYNVHIIFVAHPRKAMGFLRLQDVSGTNDLVNADDNAISVHRNNKDFQRLSKEMFQWKDTDEIYKATNVVEVAKDRDGGTQDLFVPLWFEAESRRLRNDEGEHVRYGWEKDLSDIQQPVQTQQTQPEPLVDDGFVSGSDYDEIPFD